MPASTRLRIAINTVHLFYALQYKIRRLLLRITRLAFIARVYSFFARLYASALIILPFAQPLVYVFVVSGIVNPASFIQRASEISEEQTTTILNSDTMFLLSEGTKRGDD